MKLSELVPIVNKVIPYAGDDFGVCDFSSLLSPKHMWTRSALLEFSSVDDVFKCEYVPYSLFIDDKSEYYYFSINCNVYQCKRYLHTLFVGHGSYDSLAIAFYLMFEKHQNFDL